MHTLRRRKKVAFLKVHFERSSSLQFEVPLVFRKAPLSLVFKKTTRIEPGFFEQMPYCTAHERATTLPA